MSDRHAAQPVSALSDMQLINRLRELIRDDRRHTARLLVHLAEVDARGLYLKHACSSMHAYCVERLHMSDPQAYLRIHAARTGRRYPRIFDMVARNELHLTAIAMLSKHLTEVNHDELLDAAVHKTKRQIEKLIAERYPTVDAPTLIRRLPQSRAEQTHGGSLPPSRAATPGPTAEMRPPPRANVAPTAPHRFKIQFTASAALHDKLREAQALLRHQIPDGDIAEIFERALDGLLERTKRQRFGATDRPRPGKPSSKRTRHIPNAVKRAVVERDGGQCTFVDADGNRCQATSLIEFHHIDAYARELQATTAV